MKKALLILSIAALAAISCRQSDRPTWSEEFNGDTIDTTVWSKIPRGEHEWSKHMSTWDELFEMSDGCLILKAKVNPGFADDDAPLLTGGIASKGKKSFGYGRIEIRAKLEGVHGGWPALWMMPENRGEGTEYGEIDICERLNFDDFAYQTLHTAYNLSEEGDKYQPKYGTGTINPDDFNVYAVEHHRDSICLFINDVNTITYRKMPEAPDGTILPIEKQWTFDRDFYLIVDMQVGAPWPGEAVLEELPVEMKIDWIRYYAF